MIDIVDERTLTTLDDAITTQRGAPSDDGYDAWKKYHASLCRVARRYARAGNMPNDEVDFYFSGDWFHEKFDAYALQTANGIRRESLLAFQEVVAKHGAGTSLTLAGDADTPLWGLKILITPDIVLVAWRKETAEGCKRKLNELGITVE